MLFVKSMLIVLNDPHAWIVILLTIALVVFIVHTRWTVWVDRKDLQARLERKCKQCPMNRRGKNNV